MCCGSFRWDRRRSPSGYQPASVAWWGGKGARLRKYILNMSILSSLVGGWSLYKTSTTGPRDWRLILQWVSWLTTVAIAVGTVNEQAKTAKGLEK